MSKVRCDMNDHVEDKNAKVLVVSWQLKESGGITKQHSAHNRDTKRLTHELLQNDCSMRPIRDASLHYGRHLPTSRTGYTTKIP